MTSTSLGTAASGGSGPRFTLLTSFKKRKIKTIKDCRFRVSCAASAMDARNQEMTGNSERPLDEKRGHGFNGEMISASLKRRSSNTAARESGIAIAMAAAAHTSSPIVQELAGNRDGGNTICNKGCRLPCGSVGVAMDEKAEEMLHVLDGLRQDWEVSVLDFALPSRGVQNQKPLERDHHHNGEKECWLIKRSCLTTVAVCEGSNGAVSQNRVASSTPSTGAQKPTRRSSPVQEARADGQRSCKRTKHSARMTPMRPFMSLSSGLQCLGVTNATPVLTKTLTATDCCLHQSRLQFSPRNVMESPLMSILTPEEWRSVHNLDKVDGLELEAIDQHGYSYKMRLKYSDSARQYRLMQEWVLFLTQNGVRQGDVIEVGALRVQGRPMLTLLNYSTTQGWIPEEIEAADGLLMLSDFSDRTRS
ncbi:hypothetical protein HU200_053155 [Digitaria exilis]|uniref:TF-B3 domain-containing protein n=1 Tax=Digitaria exilis TaxID=1010633 RepID=A0A835E3G0_9POAL|nr:hypothetical protein HU200_053155 [Digitaria exilis]CAB3459781.1 unnamed protein product [Digitaria exilis]